MLTCKLQVTKREDFLSFCNAKNRVCKHCLFAYQSLSVSQLSQSFFFGISGIKCVQDKIFGIFYVQINENLQICTDFSLISMKEVAKKGNLCQKYVIFTKTTTKITYFWRRLPFFDF